MYTLSHNLHLIQKKAGYIIHTNTTSEARKLLTKNRILCLRQKPVIPVPLRQSTRILGKVWVRSQPISELKQCLFRSQLTNAGP